MTQRSIGPLAAAKLDALGSRLEIAALKINEAQAKYQEHLSKLKEFCKTYDIDIQALVTGKIRIDEEGNIIEGESNA